MATGPLLYLDPSGTIDYGCIAPPDFHTQTYRLHNLGDTDLHLWSFSISWIGDYDQRFEFDGTSFPTDDPNTVSPITLAPGESFTFDITFAPPANSGQFDASLTIDSDAGQFVYGLTGSGCEVTEEPTPPTLYPPDCTDVLVCSITITPPPEVAEDERCPTSQILFLSGSHDGMINLQDLNSFTDNGGAIDSRYQTGYYEETGVMQLGGVTATARGQGKMRLAVRKDEETVIELQRPLSLKSALKAKLIKLAKSSPFWSVEVSNGSNPGDWFEITELGLEVRKIFATRRPEEDDED